MNVTNALVSPMLTDMYQLTMAYAYWKSAKHEDEAVFDLFFRQCPFQGEFAIFAGLSEVLAFIKDYHFTEADIDYVKTLLPHAEEEFFEWLRAVDCSKIKLYAPEEGTIVFPREPLIRVEGPIAVAQLLETTLLNLVNYPSLIATNAARFRMAAGNDKTMIEFGLRRAQGPDGGVSGARYSYIGGFDGTSNVKAGMLFGMPVKGTHAHAFVSSFTGLDDITNHILTGTQGTDFVKMVLNIRTHMGYGKTNEGELAAFIAYTQAFPNGFLALVDTYDTLKSGVPNYICVALALEKLGYKPVGIRLDSGDLAYLSKAARAMFNEAVKKIESYYFHLNSKLAESIIFASNDINEPTLHALNEQGHEINGFGIGTHLIACQAQPTFGGVYKLVSNNGAPRIKLSNNPEKITIPGRKAIYRLIGQDGYPLIDLLMEATESRPEEGKPILCLHPFDETKRVNVTPTKVIPILHLVWDGQGEADISSRRSIQEVREYVLAQLRTMRQDHLRPVNPTPYKVSVSQELYDNIHQLLIKEAPIGELR